MDHSKQSEPLPESPLADAPYEYAGDEVSAGLVAVVGAFAAVVLLLIVVLVQAWYYTWKGQVSAERAAAADIPATPLGRILAEQQQQLGSYHWGSDKQPNRVPIDRAMEIVAGELAAAQRQAAKQEKKTEKTGDVQREQGGE
jgi:hypothetical protein